MMPALHENLRSAQGDCFLDLFVHLFARDDVGVVVFLGAIKRAEFAIDVADIGVIDVSVNDVGDDVVAAPAVGVLFCQLTPPVRQRSQFLQWQMIKAQRLGRIDALSLPDFLQEIVQRRVVNHGPKLSAIGKK